VLVRIEETLSLDAIWQIAQDNAALNVFEKRDEGFVVLALNRTGRLDRGG